MTPMTRRGLVVACLALVAAARPQSAWGQGPISDRPDTPFALATVEIGGREQVGLVMGSKLFAIDEAVRYVARQAKLPAAGVPSEMRALIEAWPAVSPRLYQAANFFRTTSTDGLPFVHDFAAARVKAPIRYPWNLLAAAANYKLHAQGMGAPRPGGGAAPAGGGFDASAAARIDPDRDAPIMFAKSARSCIIDPGEPFYIVDGRTRTDYEGEMAVVMGPLPAYRVTRDKAMDYVFGYTIAQDLSDRGSEKLREVSMFAGTNWFDGKSIDRAAPMGPVIVPKEFLPKGPGQLRIVTRINGTVVQDGSTDQLIWSVPHLVAYLTSRLTLYPGDVILTGTPAGTGAERNAFLKPGDTVSVEIEGIGVLTTPFKALSEKPIPR